jgi:hypothetical protein
MSSKGTVNLKPASKAGAPAAQRQGQQAGTIKHDGSYRMASDVQGRLRSVDARSILAWRRRRVIRGLSGLAGKLLLLGFVALAVCALSWAAEYSNDYSGRFITPDEYLAVRVCRAMPVIRTVYKGQIPYLHQYLAANVPGELLRQDHTLNRVRRRTVADSLDLVVRIRTHEERVQLAAMRAAEARREREAQQRAAREEYERQLLASAQQEQARQQQLADAESAALAEINVALNKPEGGRMLDAVPAEMRGCAAEYIYSHSDSVAAIKQDPATIGWADMPRILAINAINDFFTSEDGAMLRDGLPERGYANPGEYLVAVAVHANTPSNYAEDSPDRPGFQPMDQYMQMDPEQAIDQVEEDALEEAAGMFTAPLADFVNGLLGNDDDEDE